jgi:CheY-like chemotaxis protein
LFTQAKKGSSDELAVIQKFPPDVGARVRVLVADDNADARLLVHTFLSLLGFEVCTAMDGREAVACAERFKPHIVFLDLWMPEMDGVEACQRMRAGPCPPPVCIFAITADVWRAADIPICFDRAFTKPVDLDRLAELVTQCAEALKSPDRRLH